MATQMVPGPAGQGIDRTGASRPQKTATKSVRAAARRKKAKRREVWTDSLILAWAEFARESPGEPRTGAGGFQMTKADPQHPGLTLRARRGVLSFEFWYTRPNTGGERGRKVLGRYPEMDLEGAREQAAEERRKVKAGIDLKLEKLVGEDTRQEVVTVRDCCIAYLAEMEQAIKTGSTRNRRKPPKLSGYHGARRAFENHVYGTIGSIPLKTLKATHVHNLLVEKMTTKDPKKDKHAQCNRVLSALHAAVAVAVREEWVERNVIPRKAFEEKKAGDDGSRQAMTEEELARFGSAVDRMESEGRLHRSAALAFRFLVLTGFRRSELLGHQSSERRKRTMVTGKTAEPQFEIDSLAHGLRWRDVDLEKGIIRLRDSKTGAQNRVIGSAAIGLLRKAKASTIYNGPEDPVCPGTKKEVYGGIATVRITLWQEAGLDMDTLSIHSLRHTFATVAANMEMRKYVGFVSELLGHAVAEVSSRTTHRYVHEQTRYTRIAADAISERIAAIMRGEIDSDSDSDSK